MTIASFPATRRAPIEDASDIAAVETLISAAAGVVSATGGVVALAGREMFESDPLERAEALTAMYAEGEVVFGYVDGRDGAVVNVALERLTLARADGGEKPVWRAAVYVEDAAEGHVLAGALAEPAIGPLAPRLLAAISDQRASLPASPGADLARIAAAESG